MMRRFSYHTGAPLRRIRAGEPCPTLFRDLGLRATAMFLRGELPRLAGPLSPITYMRTIDFEEPYTDFDDVGRLIFLRPREQEPWFSGVSGVYVAPLRPLTDEASVALVPSGVSLEIAAELAQSIDRVEDFVDGLGGARHQQRLASERARLEVLQSECDLTEALARPLRQSLQSRRGELRASAREAMDRFNVQEHDLCAAWNHIPRSRRDHLKASLEEMSGRGALKTFQEAWR